ncbi:hypothetical protein ABZS86_03015 [Streptomyces sp. NPDC005355]|uniref:hypothetical protein n=1 Tax=Streptomyces sp. NPDC005355 TaxID=3157038 RepID=UPI0033B56699
MPAAPGREGGAVSASGDTLLLSPECAVAARPGYEDLHLECRQIDDVPLPGATGVLLIHRCQDPTQVPCSAR